MRFPDSPTINNLYMEKSKMRTKTTKVLQVQQKNKELHCLEEESKLNT